MADDNMIARSERIILAFHDTLPGIIKIDVHANGWLVGTIGSENGRLQSTYLFVELCIPDQVRDEHRLAWNQRYLLEVTFSIVDFQDNRRLAVLGRQRLVRAVFSERVASLFESCCIQVVQRAFGFPKERSTAAGKTQAQQDREPRKSRVADAIQGAKMAET